jgi:TRAP-type C4-dicarboxylate transport system permease small subunit
MKLINAINNWVARLETAVLVLVLTIMVVLAFLQVVLRNVFDEGLLWGDIFLRHLVLWVGFIGASLATRDEKHISIDLLTRFVPKRWIGIPRIIINLFAAVICLLLADAAYTFVSDEILYGSTVFNDIPSWYLQIIIPIGFFIMAVRFFILAIQYAVYLGSPPTDDA